MPPSKNVPTLREPRYSQSLERGLALLQQFRSDRSVLGIADMADEMGMSRSTTHRYAITLVALGLLEQGASRKYRLSAQASDIGMSALVSRGLRGKGSRPVLEELRRATSHTAVIAVLDETEIVCVESARSYKPAESLLWMNLRVGTRLPAHHTAMGKLLLAQLPNAELKHMIADLAFTPATRRTIRSKSGLTNALRDTRKQGFAISTEESANKVIEIAVPVRCKGTVTAALGLVAHSSVSVARLVADARTLAEASATELADHLHYQPTF